MTLTICIIFHSLTLIDNMDFCTKRKHFVYLELFTQQWGIEEAIEEKLNGTNFIVIYGSKYYYEFNHIKHF